MAPVIHPGHIGLRSLGALGKHDDYPDYPDVDLDPIARFILVFVFSFLAITMLLVFLKLAGICLLACMIGCRNGPEERVVYRVYQPIPGNVQPQPHPAPNLHGADHGESGSGDAPPPPYSAQASTQIAHLLLLFNPTTPLISHSRSPAFQLCQSTTYRKAIRSLVASCLDNEPEMFMLCIFSSGLSPHFPDTVKMKERRQKGSPPSANPVMSDSGQGRGKVAPGGGVLGDSRTIRPCLPSLINLAFLLSSTSHESVMRWVKAGALPVPSSSPHLISTSTLASSFLGIMNSTLVDVLLFLLFLTLTLASPLAFPNPHPDPHPLDPATTPAATIIPARVHPNYHDPALGLSGIQIAGIIICSLVGLFILGFLALVTWDSYQDGKGRRGMDDFDDFGFGFPNNAPHARISSNPFSPRSPASDKFDRSIHH
ncbi:hypothetical protein A1Q1_07563 [Trichosporon asahii var. asahii CBS 2479]|uniref:Uncharacterized protein n=1 Tax=Trichosporon asahii var. asahii (strain ATCC 90039 / CBS 2479 / JCM 2466 / KCTC 7840 / NBRC 103889/ NCYC 2677 / UAMH 7654) TaxID=1186058 RepID=J5TJL7_TRIAS|nr:hypothetical protein A1Q1_07563 [Trichosporon asahii var. asahii CBS 2479]EJT51236.1 hypothetical protein A1Q1_07563 [Trichosporon asahii var. asahii CBS 2479]